MNIHETVAELRAKIERLERAKAEQGLTLVTLCDMVLGEDAEDRSDNALVRAVGALCRKDELGKARLRFLERYVPELEKCCSVAATREAIRKATT